MFKKLSSKVLLIIALVLLVSALFKYSNNNSPTPSPNPSPTVETENITLVIDSGENSPIKNDVAFTQGLTVFKALEIATEKENIELTTKQFDFGILVESINEHKNSEQKSWIYFVNGAAGSVSADTKELVGGETVEWKYIEPTY